jgi:phospholipase C
LRDVDRGTGQGIGQGRDGSELRGDRASSSISRRQFIGSSLALGGVAAVAAACSDNHGGGGSTTTSVPSFITGIPGSLPNPSAAPGTDLIPQIDHIVVVMIENHSFDNILGMSGRGAGFTLDSSGNPTNTNPDGKGNLIRAFHSPTPCRAYSTPSQSWNDSHTAYANGTNQGFVEATGDAAMAYYDATDVPFTYSLAQTFPISDMYFSSVMSQTFPNRRYMLAATSYGLANDTPPASGQPNTLVNRFYNFLTSGYADVTAHPPNGTIFDLLNQYGIDWKNYNFGISSLMLYPYLTTEPANLSRMVDFSEFLSDAKNGTLPSFSLIDPDFIPYMGNSEGEGDDVQYGDAFLGEIVNAVMTGPKWSSTLLVWTYDEAGGYYDHVVPPAAPVPDAVPPQIVVPPDLPGGFDRYGFRVPCGVVSPYAKPDYVSHVVADHSSLCRLVESKWNLPAMTKRDAAASNLLDMVDLSGTPAFATPPSLAAPANPSLTQYLSCTANDSQNPPPGDVIPAG